MYVLLRGINKMAKIWEPQSIEIYKSWANSIIDEAQDNLSEWEFNFIDSIKRQLDYSKQLSQKQADILEKIYAEKTK